MTTNNWLGTNLLWTYRCLLGPSYRRRY